MSMSIGSGEITAQFVRQNQSLAKQVIQAQQDNSEQASNSFVRRAGNAAVKNQQNVVDALQLQTKRGAAIDMMV